MAPQKDREVRITIRISEKASGVGTRIVSHERVIEDPDVEDEFRQAGWTAFNRFHRGRYGWLRGEGDGR